MAGRIPQYFIDELLDRADLVEVIDSRVKLKKSGRNFMACCPFHDEKTPSFSVQPEKQFYYCFGCGASGNALGFLMEYERLDFRAAVEQLAGKCGLQIPEESREDAEKTRVKRDLYSAMERADQFYREQLRHHPAGRGAITYLKSRGLNASSVTRFGLGFVPPGWDNLLKHCAGDTPTQQLLLEAGMLIHRDDGKGRARVYDRFRHRLMFPIRDARGRTIAFGGRVLGDETPKYLNSPETPIYHKGGELYGLYEARQANAHLSRLLVVEGYMDVIALAQFGIDYAVATLGTATTAAHLQRMYRHCDEIVLCFDGDAAGQAAARRAFHVALPLMEDGRQCRFLFLPDKEDPDSLIRKEGTEAFTKRIEAAGTLSDYLFEVAAEGLQLDKPDGKAAMTRRALSLAERLPRGALQALIQVELSERTGLQKAAIEALLVDDAKEPPSDHSSPPPPEIAYANEQEFPPVLPAKRPRRSQRSGDSMSLVETAIGLLVYKPQLVQRMEQLDYAELGDPDVSLLQQLVELLERRPDSSTGMLLGYWYGQPEGEKLTELCGRGIELLREGLETMARVDSEGPELDASVEQRFVDTLSRLREQVSARRLEALVDQIDALQQRGQTAPREMQAELKALLAARERP